jgi:hypothetical protein
MLSRKIRLRGTLNQIAGLSCSKINTAKNTTGRMKLAKPNRSKKDHSSAREMRGKDSSTTQHRKWGERAGKQVRASQGQLEKIAGPLWQQISSWRIQSTETGGRKNSSLRTGGEEIHEGEVQGGK